ncbi:MAG: hypothetical protein SAMD01599839_13130 [Rectinema sp.]
MHPNSLYRWVSEYPKYDDSAFPGNGTRIYNYQAEINHLEKRNRELEEEVELLKNPGSSCREKAREVQVSGREQGQIHHQEGLHDSGNPTKWFLCILAREAIRPAA